MADGNITITFNVDGRVSREEVLEALRRQRDATLRDIASRLVQAVLGAGLIPAKPAPRGITTVADGRPLHQCPWDIV